MHRSASTHHIPLEFPEVEAFQKAFRERHFKSAAENPDGVAMTAASLRVLGDRLASTTWIPFVRHLPGWLTQFFVSRADLKRLDVKWSPWAWLPTVFILTLFRLWRLGWAHVDRTHHGRKLHRSLARRLLKDIVQGEFGEVPKVLIPKDRQSLRSLVELELDREQGRQSSD